MMRSILPWLGPTLFLLVAAYALQVSMGKELRIVRKDGRPMRLVDYAKIGTWMLSLIACIVAMAWCASILIRSVRTLVP